MVSFYHVPFSASHEFAGALQPSLVALLVQLLSTGFIFMFAVQLAEAYLVPYYLACVPSYGAPTCFWCTAVGLAVLSFLIQVLMTVPAVVHVKFGKVQPKKQTSVREVARMVPLVLFNFGLNIVALGVGAWVSGADLADIRGSTDGSQLFFRSMGLLVLAEVWFFYMHYLCHRNKTLYKYVHKLHHTWTAPVALEAMYTHPIEHIIVNIGAVAVPNYLINTGLVEAIMWTFLSLTHTSSVHWGYFSDDQGFHDLHHERFTCNYGILGVLDWAHGTFFTKGFSEAVAAKKEELEQKKRSLGKE